MPTLIIGMYYNNGDGALIISDSRIMFGPDYSTERKIFEILPNIFFSTAGLTGIRDDLIDKIRNRSRERNVRDLSSIRRIFESESRELLYWYQRSGSMPTFGSDETLISGIVGGLIDGQPKLFAVHQFGYVEPIGEGFRCLGDGSRHAHNIVRTLYKPDISKERAMEIGIHAIIQTSKIDSVVDDNPQIAIFERDNCKLLNTNDNGEFRLNHAEIDRLRRKINGIEEKQCMVFELLLDGPEETKKKLLEVIDEYIKNKEGNIG